MSPEQIAAAEVKDFPPFPMLGGGFPPLPQGGFPMPLRFPLSPHDLHKMRDDEDLRQDEDKYLRPFDTPSRSSSARKSLGY